MNVSWGLACIVCVGLLVGCGGGGSDNPKTSPSSTSSATLSSVSSVAMSQSSVESSALATSSESVASSVSTSQAGSEGSSSSLNSSLNSSQQSSSSGATSSNTFTIEFKPPVIGAQGSLTQKIGQFFIPAAHAASTVHLKQENFAVVRINLAGIVQEIVQLPAEAITENVDGSWVINWDGKKAIDWLVVADVAKPLSLNVGDALTGTRQDLIYAPVTSNYIDVDVTSTASYLVLLGWIVNGNYASATFENTSINVQDEEVVLIFENLLNSSQLKIDEQALVADSIEAYLTAVTRPVYDHLFDQIKNTSEPTTQNLVHRFQSQLNTSNSIVGAWSVCDWALNSCYESWLIFTHEGMYYSIQTTKPDEGCDPGIEVGSYALNKDTGSFTPKIITDDNNHCGVSDASNSASLIVKGAQFEYKEGQSSAGIPFAKIWDSNDFIGTWISNDSGKLEILILLNTNTFVFATLNNGVSTIEHGSYEYDRVTGSFRVTQWKPKVGSSNDGFTSAKTIQLRIDSDALKVITDINPSPTKTYKRLQ